MKSNINAKVIADLYESTSGITDSLIISFRSARKLCLNFCKLDIDWEEDNLEYSLAIFLISVCHQDILEKSDMNYEQLKGIIKNVISLSASLKDNINDLIMIMPEANFK